MGTRYKTGTVANLPFDAQTMDIVLRRRGEDWGSIECNISQAVVHHSPTGFSFGYHGSGCADLALNVLHLFLPSEDDRSDVRCHDGNKVSVEAWFLHQEFKRAFIAPLPSQGGVLKGDEIQRWIDEHLPAARREAAFEESGEGE